LRKHSHNKNKQKIEVGEEDLDLLVLGTGLHQSLVICTETSRGKEKEEGIRKEEKKKI
jgi:hypothetical protein